MTRDKLFDAIVWKNTYGEIYRVMGYDIGEVLRFCDDSEIVDPDTDKVLFPKSVFDVLNRICGFGYEPVFGKKQLESVMFIGKKMGFNLVTFTASLNDSHFWQWPYVKEYTETLLQSPFYNSDKPYDNKPRTFVTFADRWRFVKDGWVTYDHKGNAPRFDGLAYFIKPYRGKHAGEDWNVRNTIHAGYFKALENAVGIEEK